MGKPWHELNLHHSGGVYAGIPIQQYAELTKFVLPAVQAVYSAANRALTAVRSLRVLNALQAFAETNGREASGLAELGLPTEATIDPYSGKPLILKHTDAGWTVYGVGENGKDDGGKFDKDMADVGVGVGIKAE